MERRKTRHDAGILLLEAERVLRCVSPVIGGRALLCISFFLLTVFYSMCFSPSACVCGHALHLSCSLAGFLSTLGTYTHAHTLPFRPTHLDSSFSHDPPTPQNTYTHTAPSPPKGNSPCPSPPTPSPTSSPATAAPSRPPTAATVRGRGRGRERERETEPEPPRVDGSHRWCWSHPWLGVSPSQWTDKDLFMGASMGSVGWAIGVVGRGQIPTTSFSSLHHSNSLTRPQSRSNACCIQKLSTPPPPPSLLSTHPKRQNRDDRQAIQQPPLYHPRSRPQGVAPLCGLCARRAPDPDARPIGGGLWGWEMRCDDTRI
jgi:hypothetical protein